MASLSGQTIQSTYPGLLKLETATNGITSTLQPIQDGLGNNTGLRISTTQLEVPNIQSFVPLKAQYYGSGTSSVTGTQSPNGAQNIILAYPFQDKGVYSFSALTYTLVTATSSSDTCEAAIYSTQLINPFGVFPHEPIISGLTIPTTGSTGQKTVVFPSPITMSGYGGGLFFVVYKISNGGVQPTVRFGNGPLSNGGGAYGQTINIQGTGYTSAPRLNGNQYQAFSGQTTFDAPFGTDLPSKQSTLVTFSSNNLGIILHTVDA
jgi:hypothetical protein